MNPLQHYLSSGASEGRNPSALFDSAAYLAANRTAMDDLAGRLLPAGETGGGGREPLVTLWGPGGVGKTRVAVRVARHRRGAATTDAVHFVDLEEGRQPPHDGSIDGQ